MSDKVRAVLIALCRVALLVALAFSVLVLALLIAYTGAGLFDEYGLVPMGAFLAALVALQRLTLLRLRGRGWHPRTYMALLAAAVLLGGLMETRAAGFTLKALAGSIPGLAFVWAQAALHLVWSWLEGACPAGKGESLI